MQNKYFRICCLLLSLVLVVNLLPFQAWAVLRAEDSSAVLASPEQADVSAEDVHIVHELEDERTEYSKVYRLSNGLHMAAVYNEPVHYEKDGHWEDIDNTLVTKDGMLRNTAGVWDVSFPQSMSSTNAVTIEKDGYTLSFYMAGQVRKLTMAPIGQEPVSVMAVTEASAQIQTMDLTAEKEAAEHPETVLENTHSRLQYTGVFSNTNVVYDLVSNRVKESIIIGAYDADLQGYQYTLNTGSLTPVLTDRGEILLIGTDKQTVVMTMPAPYLVDNNGEYSYDVTVDLQGAKGTYVLTYTLPTAWMADSSRSYPVILDPQVEAGDDRDIISDLTVSQTGTVTASLLNVGKNPAYGNMRSYIMLNSLPNLDPTDIVVEANLTLYHISAATSGFAVGVHKVSSAWDPSTITWANKPADNDETNIIQDFNVVTENEKDYKWDITEIVRDWYLKGNTGLVLRAPDAIEADTSGRAYLLQFAAEEYSIYQLPSVTIKYRNTVGIESYFTYATLGVGNAGGVYLGDSTGQITAVKQIASYASTVNPFSLNMVYNSAYFVQDGSRVYSPLQAMGLSMTMGNGWTLDVVQKLIEKDIDGTTYLMYYDGDGTVHYFTKKDGIYYDEDGLGLKVEADDNGNMVMSDDQENTWTFTGDVTSAANTWFLTSTKDNNENGYSMTYSGGKLTTITQKNRNQTEIVVATLNYPENSNQVESITDATGDNYAFTYANGNLTNVTRRYNHNASNNTYSTNLCGIYTYSGSRMIKMEDNLRKYALKFEYGGLDTNGVRTLTTGRVTAYQEFATENNTETPGFRCEISYPSYTQTTYRSYGNDRTKGTDDDLYTHYLTDYAGRTVNAYTTDHTGTHILGASTAVYTENNGTSKTNNRTERMASIGVAAQKLLPGGQFEGNAISWTCTNASISTSSGHIGDRAMKGTPTTTTPASFGRESLALKKNTPYTLSAYVKTTGLTSIQTGGGVYLKVVDAAGQVFKGDPLNYATDDDVDDGWVRISMNFIPTEDGVCTVSVVGEKANGKFYVDNMQLEQSEAPSNYNLLENSNFEYGTSYGWTLSENASVVSDMGVGMAEPDSDASGAHSVYFEGDPENNAARATQVIQVHKQGSQSYVLSGWAMANAVTDNVTVRSDPAYDNTKQFGLRATVVYQNDTENMEFYYVPFNPDVSTWQYASLTVTPERTDLEVDYITVSCVYECNANEAWFDNLSLVESTVQTFEYNADGRPITASSTNLSDQTVRYDDNGNITSVTSKGVTSTYTYDSTFTHRLVSSSNSIIKTSLTHDAVGNVLTTTLSSATDTSAKSIVTSSTYTNGGNLTASVTDAAGNTTEYGYDSITVAGIAASCDTNSAFYKTFGMPSVIRDAKDNEARYVTDTYGRVRQIEAFGFNEDENTLDKYASLKYTYGKTLLYEIQRTIDDPEDANKDIIQKYHFLYDNFGNTTSIGIGGWNSEEQITLASYEYAAMNGLLTKQTYGNGDYVEFTYDILGRAKTTTYKDENGNVDRVLTYIYTGDGQLYSIHDSRTGFLYLYTYDSIGRLIGSSVKNSDGEVLMSTRQEYNANNQLVGQHWTVGSTTYSETYTYSTTDGALTSYNNALGQTINLEYDALRRISKMDTTTLDRFYEYADGKESGQTTGMVSRYWYHTASYDDAYYKYSYSYDALGNISSYTQSGTTYTYTYDDQNQLKTQTGGGKTYTYTYDNAGNILTASDGTTTNSYTYGNTLWRDQLTAFNGQTITYDGSGNPLSYYNGKRYAFTWEEGRNLVSAVEGTNTYAYAYDSNGLRTTKVENGKTHTYLYASGKLLRETIAYTEDGEQVVEMLDFVYDHNGHPFALNYTVDGTSTRYYYITNLQGDVLTIITPNGQAAASYAYDPYGRVLEVTGPQKDTLGKINPLRYRGYYYDVETGFYYLHSRYYDPITCRFINADAFVFTNQGILGTNVYIYCTNNPVNYHDNNGNDAIWIQEGDGAEGFGHSGLLVQDSNGNWYYFYWGPTDEKGNVGSMITTGVTARCVYVLLDTSGHNLTSSGGINILLASSDNQFVKERSGSVTDILYLEGDFSATHDYLQNLYEKSLDTTGWYHLLLNNCVQKCWEACAQSNLYFCLKKCSVVPDIAFAELLLSRGELSYAYQFAKREVGKLLDKIGDLL